MRLTTHGARTHGALITYISPRLAKDAKLPDLAGILAGSPMTNRISQRGHIATAIQAVTQSRLAQDAELSDVAELLETIERVTGEEDGGDMEPNSAIPMVTEPDDDTEDEHPMIARVREFCHGKMSPEDCAKLDEMLGEEDGGMDSWDRRATDARKRMARDETEEEREKREEEDGAADARKRLGRDENEEECRDRRAEDAARHAMRRARDAHRKMGRDAKAEDRKRAEDAMKHARDMHRRARDARWAADRKRADDARRVKDEKESKALTPEDMKRAVDAAVDTAVKAARAHDATLHEALDFVRPWVGRLAIACDSAPKVYREALRMRGRTDADQIHESALRTVLELMPQPGDARNTSHAYDALPAGIKPAAERFTNVSRIRA